MVDDPDAVINGTVARSDRGKGLLTSNTRTKASDGSSIDEFCRMVGQIYRKTGVSCELDVRATHVDQCL